MNTKILARVNNVDIVSTSDEQYVAIRPICEALGVDAKAQRSRIERDEILNSVEVMMTSTGKDGKQYEMLCIPYMYIFGWLFGIDTSKVKEEIKQNVVKYKMECYRVLFEHFTEPQKFLSEQKQLVDKEIDEYDKCRDNFKNAQKMMVDAKARLDKARKITIEEWRFNDRQMNLFFS